MSVFTDEYNKLAADVYQTAKDHGWHDKEVSDERCLLLMVTEIAEATEALRNPEMPADHHIPAYSELEAELADVVIRIMNYGALRNLDVAGAIEAKAQYNKNRPYKHGGKKF